MSRPGRRQRKPSPTREILSEIGRLGRQRGLDGEAAVLAAAQAMGERLPWVTGARAGTAAEDRRGIDVVVLTTLGPLCLQVKSSHAAARSWAEENGHRLIEVVVATPVPETMTGRLVVALCRLRHRVEQRKAGRR